MKNLLQDPIDWQEGMMLEPEHLQHFESKFGQTLQLALNCQQPNPWGILHLEIDKVKLAGGCVVIDKIQAQFKNGIFIDWDINYNQITPITLPLDDLEIPTLTTFYVYIGVHKLYNPNMDSQARGMGISQSYLAANENIPENEQTPYLRPVLKLALSLSDLADYDVLPILKVEKGIDTYQIAAYQPPRFFVPNDDIYLKKLKSLTAELRRKVGYLQASQKGQVRSVDFISHMILTNLRNLLPQLGSFVQLAKVSPQNLYDITVRAVGYLSVVKSTLSIPPLPAYKHEDFYECYEPIFLLANRLLSMVSEKYSVHVFSQNNQVFSLMLDPDIIPVGDFMIGLEVPSSVSQKDMNSWAESAIMCSDSMIDHAQRARVLGATRVIMPSDEHTDMFSDTTLVLCQISWCKFTKMHENFQIFNVNHNDDLMPNRILLFSKVS